MSLCNTCKLNKKFDKNGKWITCQEVKRRLERSASWSYCEPATYENCHDYRKDEKNG
jgi:hypothetical protein